MFEVKGVYHDVAPTWNVGKSRGQHTLVYVTDGQVKYQADGKEVILGAGELFFIPSRVLRSWNNCPGVPHKKYTVVFTTAQEADNPVTRSTYGMNDVLRLTPRSTAYFEQRLAYMFVQWLGKNLHYGEITTHILAELLLLTTQERVAHHASPAKERVVRKMQDHILYHFRDAITLEELAEIGGVSPNYVTIVFREVTGTTPIQYVHQVRINTALHLFDNTRMTVREVAEYLGYCDQSHFNRVFKKWMGAAPTHVQR